MAKRVHTENRDGLMLLTKEIVASFDYFDDKKIIKVTPIKVGLCNLNYRVDCESGTVFFRVFGEIGRELHRAFEFQVQHAGYDLSIAPKPLVHYLASNTPLVFSQWCEALDKANNGVMISEFFEGKRWSDLASVPTHAIEELARQMHCLHNINLTSPCDEHEDGHEVLVHYWSDFRDKNEQASERYKHVNAYLSDLELDDDSLIHRDLNGTNLLIGSERQAIIDWEFCRNGDRYVDFATVIVELELNSKQSALLLESYNKLAKNSADNAKKLRQCQVYYLALCWLWHPNTLSEDEIAAYRSDYSMRLDQLLASAC